MYQQIAEFNKKFVAKETPDFRVGWTIKVHQKIKEGNKTRTQPFEGIVIAKKHGLEAGATFTVRKIIGSTGVEKIFPLHSPLIEKIEIIKASKVRRAKLYFLREKSKKEIRRKVKNQETQS